MRTIAVSGTAGGLGAAIRRRLESAGDRVIGIDRRDAEIVADLGTAAGLRDAVAAIRKRSGGALDGLVSCAALGPYDAPEPIVRVNYFGAIGLVDQLRDDLARGREPAAVAISSIGAIFDEILVPDFLAACRDGDEEAAVAAMRDRDGTTAYSNAKRAIARAVRERVMEWGALGVRLNAVAPGKTETPMLDKLLASAEHAPAINALPVPLGRSSPADDVAAAIVFLLGPDARYVHGQVLFVDGGSEALVRPTAY
jgi:NAD(P)-dependent dehydrogenase (short-subunit alcohol dehydrogenase family)